jgi:acyl-CoA thioesterase-2
MSRADRTDPGTLVSILDLEELGEDRYRAFSPPNGWKRVFGGQVIAQALAAATRTVPVERPVHSLHAYFLRPGDPAAPIEIDVERLRDGGSFTTRRAIARQAGEVILALAASFQIVEPGLEFQVAMPQVPPPEACLHDEALEARLAPKLPKSFAEYWDKRWPVEMRLLDEERFAPTGPAEPTQTIWMRARHELPDGWSQHAAGLAFASDYSLIDTALIAHGMVLFDPALQPASLDHAMWFHRPFRIDEWLLYVQDSPSTSGGRGMCHGKIFTEDGRLVASVAQEGLIRLRSR